MILIHPFLELIALAVAIVKLVRSPQLRAIVAETVFHPFETSVVSVDEQGRVTVRRYRDEPPDPSLANGEVPVDEPTGTQSREAR